MKNSLLLFVLLAFATAATAQKEPLETPFAVPVDSITKKITYEGVVEVKGVDAATLYSRIHAWFQAFYKNPTEVIRENDSVNFSITGKPRYRLANMPNKDGLRTDGGNAQYTITVAARDGRYKYVLTDFNWLQASYYPAERWMDTTAKSYKPEFNEYLQQTDKYARDLITELNNAVTKVKPVKDNDNW